MSRESCSRAIDVFGRVAVAVLLAFVVFAGSGCSTQRRIEKHLRKGRIYLNAQQLTKAAAEFQKALDLSPNNVDALYSLGTVESKQNQHADAIEKFKRVIEIDPERCDAYRELGLSYAANKDYDSLAELSKSMLDQGRFEGLAQNFAGMVAVSKKDPKTAIEKFSAATRSNPKLLDAWLNLASVQNTLGRYAEVERTARAGLDVFGSGQHDLNSVLAIAQVRQGKLDEAVATFKSDIKNNPNAYDSRVRLGRLYIQMNKFGELRALGEEILSKVSQSPDGKFFIGVAELQDGNYDKSVELLASVVTTVPQMVLPHLYLALAQERTGAIQQAITNARRFLENAPNSVAARVLLSRLYSEIGWLDEARRMIDQAAAIAPDNPDVLIVRGAIALGQKEYDAATKDFKKMLEKAPESIRAKLSLAAVSLDKKDTSMAIRYAREAIKIDPKDPRSHHIMGLALLQKPDVAGALLEIQKSIEIKPDFILARRSLARLYAGIGRPADAERQYRAILDIQPTSREARTALAYLLMARHKPADAVPILRGLLNAYPDDLQTRTALAMAMADSGSPADAIGIMKERAGSSKESAARVYFIIGRIEFKQKAYDRAAEALAESAKLNPQMISAAVDQGLALMMSDKAREGADVIAAARARVPSSGLAILYEAVVRLRAGQSKQSVKLLDKLDQVKGLAASTASVVPFIDVAAGDYAAARQSASQISALSARRDVEDAVKYCAAHPDADVTWIPAALALMERGWPEVALDAADKAVANLGQICLPYMVRVSIELKLGDFEGALNDCKAVLEIRPDHATAIEYAARMQVRLGQRDAAIALLEGAMKADPSNIEWQQSLAEQYFQAGRLDEARALFERVLGARTNNPQCANNLAYLYLMKNENLDKAVDLAKTAVKSLPMDGAAADTLGLAYIKTGRFDDAVRTLEKAAALAPGNPSVLYHYGLALDKSGNRSLAVKKWRAALDLGIDFPEKKDTRQALDSSGSATG